MKSTDQTEPKDMPITQNDAKREDLPTRKRLLLTKSVLKKLRIVQND